MSSNVVAKRYATALFEAASEGKQADVVSADLSALASALGASPELALIWNHRQLTAEQKRLMLQPALSRLLQSELTKNLVNLLFEKDREAELADINEEYQAALRETRQEVLAEVTVIRELSDEQRARLSQLVQRLTGCRTVELEQRIDKGILGGVILRVGDRVYDGSLARRLDSLRRQLKQAQVKQAGVSS
ncbi:MAG: ATP synthase F1 subunit delta [Bacillota bacterium]|jgi:F-type H+-transporting ATPase subunit delta